MRRVLAALLLATAACGLLVQRTTRARTDPFWEVHSNWRYVDDTTIGIERYLSWSSGPLSADAPSGTLEQLEEVWSPLLEQMTRRQRIAPAQFWRTVPRKAFERTRQHFDLPRFEDPGRAMVLSVGFALLGGVSPYLLLWLGTLGAVGVLTWLAVELALTRRLGTAAVVLFACASFPYVIETLSLPHSAASFYLLALLGVLAVAVFGVLGEGASPAGLAVRLVLASVLFTVCTLCRGGTLAFLPAFLLGLLAGGRRVARARGWRSLRPQGLLALALSAAFTLPYVVVRPTQQHNIWLSVWEGLADFAGDRGYSWEDVPTNLFLRSHGQEPFDDPKHVTHAQEEFFRQEVLGAIRREPGWYVGVLARRVVATVGLTRLAPWGPRDGYSLEKPNYHYKYTTPADWVILGGADRELPVSLLWGPVAAVLLGAAAALALRRRYAVCAAAAARLGPEAAVLGIVTLAALPVPVLISTFSGLETEAFVVACFAATGLLLDGAIAAGSSAWRARRQGRGD